MCGVGFCETDRCLGWCVCVCVCVCVHWCAAGV